MLAKHAISTERAVPRYTSYPTAPHFGPAVDADTYAGWLEGLSGSDAVSLYLHVPYCRSLCLYCGCHTKAVRRPEPVEAYAERLLSEIDLVAARTGRRRIVHLHWGGGTPSILGPARIREIVARLAARFDLSALLEHAFELDPRYVTNDLARALADVGVNRASFGVQDLSAHVQEMIGRVQPFALVQEAADVLREAGIEHINVDLMYGLPNQTVQDVRRTATLAHELRPRRFAVFGYAHVPWFKSQQRVFDEASLPAPAERMAQAAVVHETLTGLGYVPVGLDHYAVADDSLSVAARAGRLRRNFQGYTTDEAETLIGFGTSAIGRLPQGFVQNAPDTASYARAVTAGRLATVRGLVLSDTDRRRGQIIEDLMCHLSCNLDRFVGTAGDDGVESYTRELAELTPFVAEGLVSIDGRRIAVNDNGRPYLRLIAAVFDDYLGSNGARHSKAV